MRVSKLPFSLIQAICANETEAVKQYCEGKQCKGSFSPSPFALAMHTSAINHEMIEILAKVGMEPTVQDLKTYRALPESLQQAFPKSFKQKIPFTKRLRAWFQRSSLSSAEAGILWQEACKRNDKELGHYILTHYSLSREQFRKGIEMAKEHSSETLLTFLVTESLLTTPEKRGLLLYAVEKGYAPIVSALIQEWMPEKAGFFATVRHSFTHFFTHLRYGHPSLLLKNALFLALEKKQVEVAEALFQVKQLTFDNKEHVSLWEALFKGLSNPLTPEHYRLVQLCLNYPRINPGLNNIGLSLAITNGQLELVKMLLQDRRINLAAENNAAFLIASGGGHVEIVKLLLKDKRVDPTVDNNHAIGLASENGHIGVVDQLLNDPRIDPTADNNIAIRMASKNGHVGVVKLLLKHPRVNPAAENNYAIWHASNNGYVGVVNQLLKDSRVDPTVNNNIAVFLASNNGHVKVVKRLLKDPRVGPAAGNNIAIRMASKNGHVEVVKRLLKDHRVNPAADNNYAIRLASNNGHVKVVKRLLKDSRVDPAADNNVAIGIASQDGHIEVVKLLLDDPRVDPAAENNVAIRIASYSGHVEVVKLLLKDPRVDPSAENNTAIGLASEKGHIEIVKLLLKDKRVDPTARKNVAIYLALQNGHLRVAKTLSKDPRVDIVNDDRIANLTIPRLANKRDPRLLRKLLHNQHFELTTLSNPFLDHALTFKDSDALKVLLTFGSKEFLQSLYQQKPKIELEMHYVNAFLCDPLKHALKTLKAESFITINTTYLIRCSELPQKSNNQKQFAQLLTRLIDEKATHVLKENLKKAAKAFSPFLSAGKVKEMPGCDSETDKGYIKDTFFPSHLAPHLAPFLPVPLAEAFFKTLNSEITSAPKHYIRNSIDSVTKTYVDKAVKLLESKLDKSQLPAKSWMKKQEERIKNGLSVVYK